MDSKDPKGNLYPGLKDEENDLMNKDVDVPTKEDIPQRETWGRKIDFLLSCIGFAVGLGNVWRFPYLCYKNGGGAFLIPYFLCLIMGGVPIFILEISLGQFMRSGGYGIWKISPIWQGIGIATTVIATLCNTYYIVILAWDLSYLSNAFHAVLPWSHCNNTWNTPRCRVSFHDCPGSNLTGIGALETINETICTQFPKNMTTVDPVVEFWERKILQISSGVDEPGGIVWELAVSLLVVWTLCYFCIWKGVKWTGKVVYFTATFPYVVLTVLLVRGLTLPGAREGVLFYLMPDFSKLGEVQIWIDAGTQIFFSYAIALGALAALGSYNKFHNNCYRDCIFIACVNSCTSLYAGIVIFSVLGFMAYEQGVSIADVAESGPGLAFIAYPKAVTQMPFPALWAVLFFVMVIFLGLDTQFVTVEAVITVVVDQFPRLRKGWNREIFIAVYCMFSFLVGLSMVTRGGMYVFQLFDFYSASGMALLWCCFFECMAIAWTYGCVNYYQDIRLMIGYTINPWLRICWTFLTPIVTASIFTVSWVWFSPLTYNRTYHYPLWAQGLGMCLAFASMVWIPGVFIYKIISTPGSIRQRWHKLTIPILPDVVLKEREILQGGKSLLKDEYDTKEDENYV